MLLSLFFTRKEQLLKIEEKRAEQFLHNFRSSENTRCSHESENTRYSLVFDENTRCSLIL